MSQEAVQSIAVTSPPPEPKAAPTSVPIWLIITFFLLLWLAMVYFDQNSGWFDTHVYLPYHSLAELEKFQPPQGGTTGQGRENFEKICALCHNSDGTGRPNQAPPFVGSEWVLGPVNRLIRIPQLGINGPIKVKGVEFQGTQNMAAMGAALSDQDLADVLTYIRTSWGNKASPVTAAQVKAVRTELGNRTQQLSADELMQVQ
jgi:mono/diheme cytochrome c family protein